MINDGDVFLTKLERDFWGAFRVLKTKGHFDFSDDEFYLIALTSYIDIAKPNITDRQLKKILCQNRFSHGGKPNIKIYSGRIIEKHFEYLGNIPLTEKESKMRIRIGDGEHIEYGGGFPLAGAVQKNFGFEVFLEWRWEHEREQFLNEREVLKKQQKEAKLKKKIAMLGTTTILDAYRYTDEKSDKFWTVERQGSVLAVSYGKIGTIGKFQVKEYDDEVNCEKQFLKLIDAKLKKGYWPYTKFDKDGRLYFDDEKVGLHPLTSHPKFRVQFTDEFYYDCSDEEAPFGSDEGSDTLVKIEEQLRKKPNFVFVNFPAFIIENIWDMKYIPVGNLDVASIKALIEKDEMNVTQSDIVTVSCAFAQLKITGNINLELKQRALNSMQRIKIVAHLLEWRTGSIITNKMIADLTAFTCRL